MKTITAFSLFVYRYNKQILIALILLLGLSIYGCLFSFQIPESVEKNLVSFEYSHKGNFDYIASINPSSIYDNASFITNYNITTLYGSPMPQKLINSLNIVFQYDFNHTTILYNLTDIKITYESISYLNRSNLVKVLVFKEPTTVYPNFGDFFKINITNINDIIDAIDLETSTNSSHFTYQIQTKILVNATVRDESVALFFTPSLVLTFHEEIVRIDGLRNELSGNIRLPETITVTWNEISISLLRRLYILTLFGLSLFIIVTLHTILRQIEETRIYDTQSMADEMFIIDISELPQPNEQQRISTESLHDLAKISKILQRPILHHEFTYIILYNDIRYQFSKEPSNPGHF